MGKPWENHRKTPGKMEVHPLVNEQFANLKMAIEIVDLPMNSMVIFHSDVTVYQRDTIVK